VRRLEELGIGRPSTYASVVKVIKDRDYVWRKGTALIPSYTAFAVTTCSSATTQSSSTTGSPRRWRTTSTRSRTARRTSTRGFAPSTSATRRARPSSPGSGCAARREGRSTSTSPPSTRSDRPGRGRPGRRGARRPVRRDAAAGEERRPLPEETEPDTLTVERALELLAEGSGDIEVGADPSSGLLVVARQGRFGPYVQLGTRRGGGGAPEDRLALPVDDAGDGHLGRGALAALAPEGARRGRRGTRGDSAQRSLRALPEGGDRHPIAARRAVAVHRDLGEALALFAQPKTRGRRAAAAPLRELGDDPASGKAVTLRRDGSVPT